MIWSRNAYLIRGLLILGLLASDQALSVEALLSDEAPTLTPYDVSQEEITKLLNWQSSDNGEDLCKGYFKQPSSLQTDIILKPIAESKTHLTASGPTYYRNNGLVIVKDNVVLEQPGRVYQADQANIYRNVKTGKTEKVILIGHVKIMQHNEITTASYATINYKTNKIILMHSVFHDQQDSIDGKNMWGVADQITRDSDNISILKHATLSMCPPEKPFWSIKANTIKLDQKKDQGLAHNAILKIKSIPVFYMPVISFVLNNDRRSGFLWPTVGHSSFNGYELSIPYYFNLAVNYDDLFTPTWLSRHGWQLNNSFRYLTEKTNGSLYFSGLIKDNSFDDFKSDVISRYPTKTQYIDALNGMSSTRGYVKWSNQINFSDNLKSNIEINYVSDPYYFNDFETNDGTLWARQLLNKADLTYDHNSWTATALVEAYQTMHLITGDSDIVNQYQRLPELDASGALPDIIGNLGLTWQAQLVDFAYSSAYSPETYELPVGLRLYAAPSVEYPITKAFGYINPSVGVSAVGYDVDSAADSAQDVRASFDKSRAIPIVDVDSGLYFDRDLSFRNSKYTQTVEPRLFYLYVPYEDQSSYPVFDTTVLPFTTNSLYATNAYTGVDRLQNANQLTIGVSSHINDAETSAEKISFDLGIIDYFSDQKVCLTSDCSEVHSGVSPLVVGTSFYPIKHWSTTISGAFDTEEHIVNNVSVMSSYNKQRKSVIDLGYSFIAANTDSNSSNSAINLITLGAAVPLSDRFSALGYWYQNLNSGQLQSYFAGIEYDTCCWAARVTANRYYNYSANEYNTGYFFEILLKGLGGVGTSASSLIANSIPGYSDIFKQN